jgi:3-hydroxyisobutyrate dehydrogenase
MTFPENRISGHAEPAILGFLGLGIMREPMALNLLREGHRLTVFSRTRDRTRASREAGAVVATSPADVFSHCRVVFMMLANATAIDAVLRRGTPSFAAMVGSRVLVNMGTVAPEYSVELSADVQRHGGVFVEAPVSGSRTPAETGELVAMLAGDPTVLAALGPTMSAMCARQVVCGPVPQALLTKLSVNLYLIAMVTGLAEGFAFAEKQGVDLDVLVDVLDAGPLASSVSRTKAAKLRSGDVSPQASISDVLYNSRLIAEAVRDADADAPLLDVCVRLFARADAAGRGVEDMVMVLGGAQGRG